VRLAEELHAERQAADREQRQRDRRAAQGGAGHVEDRVAGGSQAQRRHARGAQGDAGVDLVGQQCQTLAHQVAAVQQHAVFFHRHAAPRRDPRPQMGADGAAVAGFQFRQRPGLFPVVDRLGDRAGLGDGLFQQGDAGGGGAVDEVDALVGQRAQEALERVDGGGVGHRPAGGVQHGQGRWLVRRQGRGAAGEGQVAGVAADDAGDGVADRPAVFEGRREGAEAVLAELVADAAAVQGAEAGLQPDHAAEAGRAQDRAADLAADRHHGHAGGDRGGRA
jgi:hypothetical protein